MPLHPRLTTTAITACLLIACEQHSAPHSTPPVETPTPESSTPADSASAERSAVARATASRADRIITVRAVIANLSTEYSATFAADQLRSIAETRDSGGRRAQGHYAFFGARLTRYSGEQLGNPRATELRFDLQGVLLTPSEASDLDIEAIKRRAQLLRSHALAQAAARAH
jgi:hypothetical protein